MNIVICDDNRELVSVISDKVRELLVKSAYSDLDYNIAEFNNPVAALKHCFNNEVSIVFLDIDMPGMNGFDVAEILNRKSEDIMIIFVSSFDNYVYTSLKFHPFRFIRKAHIEEELKEAIDSALNEILLNQEFILLGSKYFNKKLFLSDIYYFESKRNYVDAVCANDERYTYRDTVKNLEKRYSGCNFVRVHSGFLVNMKYIKQLYKNTVLLEDGTELCISRTFLKNVRNEYAKYIRG